MVSCCINYVCNVTDGLGSDCGGIAFDAGTNVLDVNFSFDNLDGGLLFAAASGIHLHLPTLVDDLLAGEFYLNIHSQTFGGGELRGTLAPAAVPEPSSVALLGLAFGSAIMRRRRK